MKFPWHSDKGKAADGSTGGNYSSAAVVKSRVVPGVTFTIAKMSFGRRVELMRRGRGLSERAEGLAAGGGAGGSVYDRQDVVRAAGGIDAAGSGTVEADGVSGGWRRLGRQDGCGAATCGNRTALCGVGREGDLGAGGGCPGGGPRTADGGRSGGTIPRGAGGSPQRDRVEPRRTKKLLVAFHFQFSNQAGWECDACRRSGLEVRRRCGWLGLPHDGKGAPVWARKAVAIESCPKSYITAESEGLVEDFLVRPH